MFEASSTAVARARRGEGPTLIECKTYRFEEHEVGLVVPGQPYRTTEEVDFQRQNRDPVVLFRAALLSEGVKAAELEAIEREAATAVADAIAFGEESALPDPETLYDYMYSRPVLYPRKAGRASAAREG